MAQEEPQVELYDFLYRDSNRLSSYYSQIFRGKLASLEQTDSSKQTTKKKGKGDAKVASVELGKDDEIQKSQKRIIDPHDTITTDVLSYIINGDFVSNDVQGTPNGALILCKGVLVLADRHILELTGILFDAMMREEKSKKHHLQDRNTLKQLEFSKRLLEVLPLPSAFFLQTETGDLVAGTIKDEGMEEPIATYHYKHGTEGLSDVYLLGIKEVSTSAFVLPSTDLIRGVQEMADAMNKLLFPDYSINVTPLALFRKL
jgi:hypothetical protein